MTEEQTKMYKEQYIKAGFVYEDQLPKMTSTEYGEWFENSIVVDGVRMGLAPIEMLRNKIKRLESELKETHNMLLELQQKISLLTNERNVYLQWQKQHNDMCNNEPCNLELIEKMKFLEMKIQLLELRKE
jgi:hypothetical protein